MRNLKYMLMAMLPVLLVVGLSLPIERVVANSDSRTGSVFTDLDDVVSQNASVNASENQQLALIAPLSIASLTSQDLSQEGQAYAVLTASNELVFFRSTEDYSQGNSAVYTDINDEKYSGTLFSGVEDTGAVGSGSNGKAPWSESASRIVKVSCAEGQLIKPKNLSNWFKGCVNLAEADLSGFDTSQATEMINLFNGCSKLTELDISNFDMSQFKAASSNVDKIYNMFAGTTNLTKITLGTKSPTLTGENNNCSLYFPAQNDFKYYWQRQEGGADDPNLAPLSPRNFFYFYKGDTMSGTWVRKNVADRIQEVSAAAPMTRVASGTLMPANPLYISDGFDMFSTMPEHNVKQKAQVRSVSSTAGNDARKYDITRGQWKLFGSNMFLNGGNWTDPETGENLSGYPYQMYFPQMMPVNEYCKHGICLEWPSGLGWSAISAEVYYPCVGTFDGRAISATLNIRAVAGGTPRLFLNDLFYAGGYAMDMRHVQASISFSYLDDGSQVNVKDSGLAYLSQNYYRDSAETLLMPYETTRDIWIIDHGHMDLRTTMIEVPGATPYVYTYYETYANSNDFPDRLTHPLPKEFNYNSTYFRSSDETAFHYLVGMSAAGLGSYTSQVPPVQRNKTTYSGWFAFSSQVLTAVIPDNPVKSVDKTEARTGDKVTYTVTQPIPSDANMQETYNSLVFTDTLPDELEYNGDLKVYDENGKDVTATAGEIAVDGNTVTYTFSEEYLTSVDDAGMVYKGGDMTFVLSGTVKKGMAGHTAKNKAFLNFNNVEAGKKETNEVETEIPLSYSDLKVSKAVDGDDADENKEFTFQVWFYDKTGQELVGEEFSYEGSRTGAIASGGSLTLKGGESVTICDIPEETTWRVSESPDAAHGYEVKPARGEVLGKQAESSEIEYGKVEELAYTNHKDRGMGALKVSKTVEGDAADPEQVFHFQVRLYEEDGSELIDAEFPFTGDESGFIASGGTFPLKAGESVEVSGLPAGTRWTVNEVVADAHGYEIKPVQGEVQGAEAEKGTIQARTTANLSYTNVKNHTMGSLAISKVVTGEGADTSREFKFSVTIGSSPKTSDDESTEAEFAYTGSREGFIANGGTISLKHGETVTIEGLPSGTPYTVEEEAVENYASSAEGATGQIPKGTAATAAFTNAYSPDDPEEGDDPDPDPEDPDPEDPENPEPEDPAPNPRDEGDEDTGQPGNNEDDGGGSGTPKSPATKQNRAVGSATAPKTGDAVPLVAVGALGLLAAMGLIIARREVKR